MGRASILSLLCLCAIASTSQAQDRSPTTSIDPWFRPAWQAGEHPLEYKELAPSQLVGVIDLQMRPEAESLLLEQPFREITVEKAAALLSKHVSGAPGRHLYLLRALYLAKGGVYQLFERDGRIIVNYGVLSRVTAPMRRSAVVASLDRAPTEVYVECSAAE